MSKSGVQSSANTYMIMGSNPHCPNSTLVLKMSRLASVVGTVIQAKEQNLSCKLLGTALICGVKGKNWPREVGLLIFPFQALAPSVSLG